MKKFVSILLAILLFLFLSSCSNDTNDNVDNRFSKLISYAQSSNPNQLNTITWSDNISKNSTNEVYYSLEIKETKKIILTGITRYPYNSGIEMEDIYTLVFVFGSEKDGKLSYSITLETIMHKLKDAYNYYPYVLDEYKLIDNKAVLSTINYTASCYYESLYSKNSLFSYSNPNSTLEGVSEDCFKNLNKYFNNRIGITLFA